MVQIKVLDNGIRVVMERMPSVRSVAIGVWIKVGSANENNKNNGISHIIEHMLFKGTKKRSAKQIADDTSAIGGHMNAFTGKECTCFYSQVLDTHIEKAIDILSDMIIDSVFDAKEFEKEKTVILDEIDMYEDSPEDMAHEMLHKKIWDQHPLGYQISGEKDVVRKITREDVIDFKDHYYTGKNIVISVAGNFQEDEIIELITEYFGEIQKENREPDLTKPDFHQCFVKINKEIEQAHLCIAYEGIDYTSEDRYVLSIINTILGAGMNSRLFQEVREDLGLTYSIYSYISSYKNAGLLQIYAGMNPQNIEVVYKRIIQTVETLIEKGIDEDELQKTVEQIKSDIIIGLESTNSRMNGNGKAILLKNEIVTQDEIIERMNQITVSQVNQFIQKILMNHRTSVSVLGDFNALDVEGIEELWRSLSK